MTDLGIFIGQTITVAIGVAAVTMILSLFFRWLPKLGPVESGIKIDGIEDVFEVTKSYDLLLNSGQRLEGLQFVGLLCAENNPDLRWALRNMALFQHRDGRRAMLRLDTVRVFEEALPQQKTSANGK